MEAITIHHRRTTANGSETGQIIFYLPGILIGIVGTEGQQMVYIRAKFFDGTRICLNFWAGIGGLHDTE